MTLDPWPRPQDLEALVTRDQDLQQLRLGLVVPAAQPPLSWQQQQEAFDNYLRLVYGPGFLVSVKPPPAALCPGPPRLPVSPASLPGRAFWKGVPAGEHCDPHSRERDLGRVHLAQSCQQCSAGGGLCRSPNSASSPLPTGPGSRGPAPCPPSPSPHAHPTHTPGGAQQGIPGKASHRSHLYPDPVTLLPPCDSSSLTPAAGPLLPEQ